MEEKMRIIKEYSNEFKFERYAYLTLSIIVILILLFFVYKQIDKPNNEKMILGSIFGATGVIGVNIKLLFGFMDKISENIEKHFNNN